MKHFRRLEQPEIVETLQRVTGVSLEDPRLTALYDLLVAKGDYMQAEHFISNVVMSEFSWIFSFSTYKISFCNLREWYNLHYSGSFKRLYTCSNL